VVVLRQRSTHSQPSLPSQLGRLKNAFKHTSGHGKCERVHAGAQDGPGPGPSSLCCSQRPMHLVRSENVDMPWGLVGVAQSSAAASAGISSLERTRLHTHGSSRSSDGEQGRGSREWGGVKGPQNAPCWAWKQAKLVLHCTSSWHAATSFEQASEMQTSPLSPSSPLPEVSSVSLMSAQKASGVQALKLEHCSPGAKQTRAAL
jgi:hypothetical protein